MKVQSFFNELVEDENPNKNVLSCMRILIGALFIVFSSCSDSGPSAQQAVILFEPKISIIFDEMTPAIIGETNLPDDTSLMVSVHSTELNWTGCQFPVETHNGKFKTGRIVDSRYSDKLLRPGTYTARVTLCTLLVQPESVQAVIGKTDKGLTGPLVKDIPNSKGPDHGHFVEAEKDFKIYRIERYAF
jgi:hypothetical protein